MVNEAVPYCQKRFALVVKFFKLWPEAGRVLMVRLMGVSFLSSLQGYKALNYPGCKGSGCRGFGNDGRVFVGCMNGDEVDSTVSRNANSASVVSSVH